MEDLLRRQLTKKKEKTQTEIVCWLLFDRGPYDGEACEISFLPPEDLFIPETVVGVGLSDYSLYLLSIMAPQDDVWYYHYKLEDLGENVYSYEYIEKEVF